MVQRVRQAPGATRRNPTTVRALSYAHAFVPKLWARFADAQTCCANRAFAQGVPMDAAGRLTDGRPPPGAYLQPCSYRSSRRTTAASSVPFVEFVLKSACSFAETRTASMLCAA